MQFLTFILTGAAALFSGTIASAVPPVKLNTTDIERRGNGAFMSFMQSIPGHGKPYCSPTGEGTCNIAFVSNGHWSVFLKALKRTDVYVYDRDCRELGHQRVMAGFKMRSEMPFIVVGDAHRETFSYSTKDVLGPFYSKCIEYYSTETKGHVTQCAFECWRGCYRHGAGDEDNKCDPNRPWHRSDEELAIK